MKPIALNMVAALGTDEVVHGSGLPISAMGGVSTWSDAAEFRLIIHQHPVRMARDWCR